MKAERKREVETFVPITITLETEEEARIFKTMGNYNGKISCDLKEMEPEISETAVGILLQDIYYGLDRLNISSY